MTQSRLLDPGIADALAYHRSEAAAHRAIVAALEDGTYESLMAFPTAYVPVWFVAGQLGLTHQAVNNRLMRLVNAGVCRRKREGQFFVYHWIAKVGA